MRATFVTLAAYDWRLLPTSMAAYYDHADEILVGLDCDRVTWGGKLFALDRAELERALPDPAGKIQIVEGMFHGPARGQANGTAERQFLANIARNDWIVEVDADELVLDVPALLATMARTPVGMQVCGVWRNVFKVIGDTALVVDSSESVCALATRNRSRLRAKLTGEVPVVAPVVVEHLTMARSRDELALKLASWGHMDDVLPGWLASWDSVTLENYAAARNLHPFEPGWWPRLRAVPVAELGWRAHLNGGTT